MSFKVKKFVHVVNFWLKKDLTHDATLKFEESIQTLERIESIVYFNVGKPASTRKPNIDSSFNYCLLTVFNDIEGHDTYQEHPIHLQFLKTCAHLWEKVLVFDSE